MFLVRKHRVVLVRKHKGLFGVSLCSSGQEIQYWVSRLISKLSTPRKPIIFHSVILPAWQLYTVEAGY